MQAHIHKYSRFLYVTRLFASLCFPPNPNQSLSLSPSLSSYLRTFPYSPLPHALPALPRPLFRALSFVLHRWYVAVQKISNVEFVFQFSCNVKLWNKKCSHFTKHSMRLHQCRSKHVSKCNFIDSRFVLCQRNWIKCQRRRGKNKLDEWMNEWKSKRVFRRNVWLAWAHSQTRQIPKQQNKKRRKIQ